jgi:hypothetical protein
LRGAGKRAFAYKFRLLLYGWLENSTLESKFNVEFLPYRKTSDQELG